jgi:hypothetical protein
MSDDRGRPRSGGEARRAEEQKVQVVYVAAHPENGERVALWETHPDHPTREVFVAGQDSAPVQVALTPAVKSALAPQGDHGDQPPRLVRLEGEALSQRQELAKQNEERRSLERQQASLNAGLDPKVIEERDRNAKALEGLTAKLAELEGKLAQSRDQHADTLSEEADKEAHDPERRAQRAKEEEEQGVLAPNPANLSTYDYNEPRQLRTDEDRTQPIGSDAGRTRENVRRRREVEKRGGDGGAQGV